MLKKTVFVILAGFCISLAIQETAHSFVLLSKEEALEKIFGKGTQVVPETKELKGDTLKAILGRLDGRLVYEQEGSESAKVNAATSVEFHFGMKDGNKIGTALIDTQPGKWGPVQFIVALDLKGVVKAVYVMSYEEKRGRPIAQVSYMRQYVGKTSTAPLEVGKDITGISGATISSRCATYTVKKAIVLYEELYLKNQ